MKPKYLIREKMSGESDEYYEGATKFSPDEKNPDILTPGQNFNPTFLSPTKTFTQNFILQPKVKSKFLRQGIYLPIHNTKDN